jgi:hypothetical protein
MNQQPLKVVNIYSHILAGIQNNLTVRKTQSESNMQANQTSKMPSVTPVITAYADEKDTELADIFEVESIKEICDLPGLDVVKRLSCFEEICPSELDEEYDAMMQLSNTAADSTIGGLTSPMAGLNRYCSQSFG